MIVLGVLCYNVNKFRVFQQGLVALFECFCTSLKIIKKKL